MTRVDALIRLYRIFDTLETAFGGKRFLAQLAPSASWPRRGVYFFFEPGELRTGSGHGPRLVRVGTHALHTGAQSTLHQRLRQHAGKSSSSGGNHRGSIFRLLIGDALLASGVYPPCPSWGVKGDLGKAKEVMGVEKVALAAAEAKLEAAVSNYLGQMPFLWLPIDDEPGPQSKRGFIEQNVIALASQVHGPAIDPPSPSWLGHNSTREKVRSSGLWNQRHVDESYNPDVLDVLEADVQRAPFKAL